MQLFRYLFRSENIRIHNAYEITHIYLLIYFPLQMSNEPSVIRNLPKALEAFRHIKSFIGAK